MWIIEIALEPTDERLAARPEHRRTLSALHEDGIVRMAGPLADDSSAIIILDVDARSEVDDVLEHDPYYQTPGVTVTGVREWAPFLT
jgi:uncharacterized protein YciI